MIKMDEIYDEFDGEQMPEQTITSKHGNVQISSDVISTIAKIAAEETPGVDCMYTSFPDAIAERLGTKKIRSKGVKIEMDGQSVIIDLYLIIKYGSRVHDTAVAVQENVKENVQTMTGLNVTAVNVHVEGMHFDKKQANEDIGENIEVIDDEADDDEIED